MIGDDPSARDQVLRTVSSASTAGRSWATLRMQLVGFAHVSVRPAFGDFRGSGCVVMGPFADVRALAGRLLSCDRPRRRPPPTRSSCEDWLHRHRQIRTLGFAQIRACAAWARRELLGSSGRGS